jgi:hypothetical protein
MTLTINLLTSASAEVIDVTDPVAAALELLARGLSPIGTTAGGQVVRTTDRVPVGTFQVR